MKVLDHEPHSWFLFEDAGALFLDANCSHGVLGYGFLIQLSRDEMREYRLRGRDYLDRLAEDIHSSAPIAAGSHSIYRGRDLSALHRERVAAAIGAWRRTLVE